MSKYFTCSQHLKNYQQLKAKFARYWSSEYAAAAYVTSLPEIYNRINWDDQDSPVAWYFEWVVTGTDKYGDEDGYHAESKIVGGLSGIYQELVRGAVELFTSGDFKFDLMHFLGGADQTLYLVFLQMIEIRRRSSILRLSSYSPDLED